MAAPLTLRKNHTNTQLVAYFLGENGSFSNREGLIL